MSLKSIESVVESLPNKKITVELKSYIVEIAEKYPLLITNYTTDKNIKSYDVLKDEVAKGLNELKTKYNVDITYDEFIRIFNYVKRNFLRKVARGRECNNDFEHKLQNLVRKDCLGNSTNVLDKNRLLKEYIIEVADKYPLLTKGITPKQKLKLKGDWEKTVANGLNELKTKYNVDITYDKFKRIFDLARISLQLKLKKRGECNSDSEHKLKNLLQKRKKISIPDLCKIKRTFDQHLIKKFIVETADKYPLLVKKLTSTQRLQVEDKLIETIATALNELKTKYDVNITYEEFKKKFFAVRKNFKSKLTKRHQCNDYELKIPGIVEKAKLMNLSDFHTLVEGKQNQSNDDPKLHLERIYALLQKQIEISNFQADTHADGEVIGYDFKPEEFLAINIDGMDESSFNMSNSINDIDLVEVNINESNRDKSLNDDDIKENIIDINDTDDDADGINAYDDGHVDDDNSDQDDDKDEDDLNLVEDDDSDNVDDEDDFSQMETDSVKSIEVISEDSDSVKSIAVISDNSDSAISIEVKSQETNFVKPIELKNQKGKSNKSGARNVPSLKTLSNLPKMKKCCVRIKRLNIDSQNCFTSNRIASESSSSSNDDFENPVLDVSMDVTEENDFDQLSINVLEKRCLIENIKQVRMQIAYYQNKLKMLSN